MSWFIELGRFGTEPGPNFGGSVCCLLRSGRSPGWQIAFKSGLGGGPQATAVSSGLSDPCGQIAAIDP